MTFKLNKFFGTKSLISAKEDDGFEQGNVLIENEESINLIYQFFYKGKNIKSNINIINPFRASAVLGTPGSGKSYAVIEEFFRQQLNKDFCGIVYDYKDPALSTLCYNYFLEAQKSGGLSSDVRFGYISFSNPQQSNRVNPLKYIKDQSDAIELSTVILTALNKSFSKKQGDFFVESAKTYLGLIIFFLASYKDKEFLSLPHVIKFLSIKTSLSLKVLKIFCLLDSSAASLYTAFKEAADNNVLEQLSGQTASAQLGIGVLSDKIMSYVLTEDKVNKSRNIELDVNNPQRPMVLCIGNNPQKESVYGMACSVLLSQAVKIINQQDKKKSFFNIDELPTVYIRGLDTLIGTGRSNKIAVLAGLQDFEQLVASLGREVSDPVLNMFGNLFSGAVNFASARKLAESFGNKNIVTESKSVSDIGTISYSISEKEIKRIPEDKIATLSQGEFVGRISDNYGQEMNFKLFHGNVISDNYKPRTKKIPTFSDIEKDEFEIIIQETDKKILFEVNSIFDEFGYVTELCEKVTKNMSQTSFYILSSSSSNSIFLYFTVKNIINILKKTSEINSSYTAKEAVLIFSLELSNFTETSKFELRKKIKDLLSNIKIDSLIEIDTYVSKRLKALEKDWMNWWRFTTNKNNMNFTLIRSDAFAKTLEDVAQDISSIDINDPILNIYMKNKEAIFDKLRYNYRPELFKEMSNDPEMSDLLMLFEDDFLSFCSNDIPR